MSSSAQKYINKGPLIISLVIGILNQGNIAVTVCSWSGLAYSIDGKERNLYFETFLKFIGSFRTLNNYKLRILIGGLFNVDLKVIQVCLKIGSSKIKEVES